MDTFTNKFAKGISQYTLPASCQSLCPVWGRLQRARKKALASENLFSVASPTTFPVGLSYFSAPIIRLEKPPAGHSMTGSADS